MLVTAPGIISRRRAMLLDAALGLVDGPVAALAVRAAVARALAAAAPQRPPRRRAARVAGDDGGRADEVEERVAPPVEERLRARARGVRRLAQGVVGREEPAQLVDPGRDLVRVRDEEDLGRTREIQRRFNVSVPRERVPENTSTLRDRSKR